VVCHFRTPGEAPPRFIPLFIRAIRAIRG
jgi:hypothetical protein